MSTPTAGPDDRSPISDEQIAEMLESVKFCAGVVQTEAFDDAAALLLADFNALVSALRSARRDVARLDAFAAMLERSAGTKLDGLIEVTFAVDLPDGGSVSVGFGVNDRHSAGSAAEALRAALDARIPASSPPILEKNDR